MFTGLGQPSPWIVYLQVVPGQFLELFPGGEGDAPGDGSAPPRGRGTGYNHKYQCCCNCPCIYCTDYNSNENR